MSPKKEKWERPHDYVCPKRRGRKTVITYLEAEVAQAMREIVNRQQITLQDAVEQLCIAYVRTGGKIPGADGPC
jgi:23S rRNA A1618 N6-methylase RlmF